MPYGSVDQVKGTLHTASNITAQDAEILKMIAQADDFIDTQISIFAPTPPPLSNPIPEQIRRMSNQLAIEWYYHYNTPLHPMEGVTNVEKIIEKYFRAIYAKQSDTIGQNRITKTASGITGTEG